MSVESRAQIGLLNIMPYPSYLKTEYQWRDSFGEQLDIVPVRFDKDPRDGSRTDLQEMTYEISDVASDLDGLILTGANLEVDSSGEAIVYERIAYYDQLKEVIDWTTSENRLSIFSCLSSHIALKHLFDIDRVVADTKTFGVFDHQVVDDSWIVNGIGSNMRSPHSRWGYVGSKLLEDSGVKIVSASEQAGWLIGEHDSGDRTSIFIQGHPEYQRDDLHAEYLRDRRSGLPIPVGYYPDNDCSNLPEYNWGNTSTRLFSNIATSLEMAHT